VWFEGIFSPALSISTNAAIVQAVVNTLESRLSSWHGKQKRVGTWTGLWAETITHPHRMEVKGVIQNMDLMYSTTNCTMNVTVFILE
jgi:glucose-6-phosphate dehydrogenase assembly protein OpcA